ncbi:MAG: ribbon-helix-helix protein, CopG family [Candidatus Yonathbacteria bacterium]|nr:ribbon-helix-helix protein, CopG family [Candidatus Yonathbacteria bacterium]
MRTIINISVPASVKKEVENEVKTGGYASVSEFFRAVIRERKENMLLRDLGQSRFEFKSSKGKKLHSLKDLR